MFLVDTDIVSALAPTKRVQRADLARWFERAEPYLYLSVVTASEIISGVSKLRRDGQEAKATALQQWWTTIEHVYAKRILPVDLRIAYATGLMLDQARAFQPSYDDVAIAATAQVHGLTVLTANEKHFAPLGVAWQNPLEALPPLPP